MDVCLNDKPAEEDVVIDDDGADNAVTGELEIFEL